MTHRFWTLFEQLKGQGRFEGEDNILPVESVHALTTAKVEEIESGIKAREREINRVLSFKDTAHPKGELVPYLL